MKKRIITTVGLSWIMTLVLGHLVPSSAYSIEEKRPVRENSTAVNRYLKNLREVFEQGICPGFPMTIHLVFGNEAADLDSICGSIARARYLAMEYTDVDGAFFPVINIRRDELDLRKDAKYLFQWLGVDQRSLIFIDEVPLEALNEEERLKLHLVDHNQLAVHQSHLHEKVLSIVDHHADENVTYPYCDEENKMIEDTGSATTLIAREILTSRIEEVDAGWASLMLAPILLDTLNLTSKYKTTPLDQEVVERLAAISEEIEADKIYHELSKRRYDTTGMTMEMLLRKDKKNYQSRDLVYSISSLPCGAEFALQDHDALEKMREENGTPLTLVMGRESRESKRFLWIHSQSLEFLEKILRCFEEKKELSRFRLIFFDEKSCMAAFRMPRSYSRKKFQPKFHTCLNNINCLN